MVRPIKPKPVTEHLLVLMRMQRSVELDEVLEAPRKGRLTAKIGELMEEFRAVAGPVQAVAVGRAAEH